MIYKVAELYSKAAHGAIGQKRKYSGEPYWKHCEEVVQILQKHIDDVHENTLAAAWLHDVLEDTKITYQDLVTQFGKPIADLVLEVTDVSMPEDGNRARRKQLDKEHLAKASKEGQDIKVADLISNSRNIVFWDVNFAKVYLREKESLLEVLTLADKNLLLEARSILEENKSLLLK